VSLAIEVQLKEAKPYDVWVIEIIVAKHQLLLLQAYLLAEDGLGVIRCFDPEKHKQQLWVSVCQRHEAYAWLLSLPLMVEISAQWLWREV